MKKSQQKVVFTLILGLCFFFIQAQNTPPELRDLVDMKAAYLDNEMSNNGYIFIKNNKSNSSSYNYYWNSEYGKCVAARVNNGRVASIKTTSNSDCDKGNNHNNNESSTIDIDELKGMKSKAAYVSLEQHGYSNTKTFQEDDVTYKLWYNSKSDHCLKTYSKNYYIARIENSNNCK